MGEGLRPLPLSVARRVFRKPALERGGYDKRRLAKNFGGDFEDDPNGGREWTVKLRTVDDAKRLSAHIEW